MGWKKKEKRKSDALMMKLSLLFFLGFAVSIVNGVNNLLSLTSLILAVISGFKSIYISLD